VLRHRFSSRSQALGALGLVLLAVALILRLATEATPPLRIERTLAAYVRLPGSAPALAWPREGQAAMQVQGIGPTTQSGSLAPVPIASVAKVMTAYLTLLAHPLAAGAEGFEMTITPAEVAEEEERAELLESVVPVRAGERLSERQALEALLLPSANNIAALLAVHDAGTIAAFVARMNATALALGMRSTHYTDPSGFNDRTVSTAADQLRLAGVAMRQPAFAAIVAEQAAELPIVGSVANLDGLLGSDGYVGIKTGSDRAAGGCFMFAKRVTVGGQRVTILGVVLGQREGSLVEAALASARRLGDSLAAALRLETVLPAGTGVLRARDADGNGTAIATAEALREVAWGGLELPVRVTVTRPLPTRLRTGQALARVSLDSAGAPQSAAVAARAVGGASLGWRLRHLL
jgi:D-alanyl-D-alanine carboxypeptidase (penicillin-binding protein 5/6)